MTIETRRAAFRDEPCTATARRYVDALFDAWSGQEIGRDTLRNGLVEVSDLLTEGLCDLGHPVQLTLQPVRGSKAA